MRALTVAEELALEAASSWSTRPLPPAPRLPCGPDLRLRTWDSYANLAPARPVSYSFDPARRAGKASIAAAVERLVAADAAGGYSLDAWQRVLLEQVFEPRQNGRASFRAEGPGWFATWHHDPSAGRGSR